MGDAELPSALQRFVALFNRREFWESHEVLEAPWREHGSEFYHGLILYASAFVHVQRGNPHGIVAQFEKTERALERYRPAYLGFDVDRILAHAERCRGLVSGHRDDPAAEWERLIPLPTLEPEPARVRGDEPEVASR